MDKTHAWLVFFMPVQVWRFTVNHCFLVRQAGPKHTMVVDPGRARCAIDVVPGNCFELAKHFLRPGWECWHLTADAGGSVDMTEPPRRRGPFLTCAAIVAHMMGLNAFVFSTRGLKLAILKAGGEKISS